ncbi:MAG TPA: maltose ABC transporter permease MalF [Kofleriaceae bacterium]|jgi:maltose/maltodextrin transport system permease protein|nr:maltose ABC transporter permease MalF [Kofleriaceae bacterium]
MQLRHRRIGSRLGAAVAALAGLAAVYQLYISGSPVLAAAFAGGFGLAYFVYTARRAYTFRYLFPGLAGIALFIVLPLVYTVWIGFTNYSSKNLLTFERATEVLLDEVYERSDARYRFTLHAADGGFRIVLHAGDEEDSAAPAFVSDVLPLVDTSPQRGTVRPLAGSGVTPGDALPLKDVIARRDAIHAVTLQLPDGTAAQMASLREFSPYQKLYQLNPDHSLTNRQTSARITPNFRSGFYETATGQPIEPGFRVSVGFDNYVRVFTDAKFSGPFIRVFVWTLVFAGITVVLSAALGMLLAELLSWEGLKFAWLYRLLLFLPYAVPGFISILVFKGLFNRNFGEINLILDTLFGIRPNWTGNPMLARGMILLVNVWLGYPYFMLICMGLQKSIPHDLYEASALAGAGPWTNFRQITWPMIRKPLTPLLVSAFAFNFNNFVLIYLLTQGRPDFLDTTIPAGETDILVSYTYRIAFEDTGQQFGLASTISTVIFAMVAILSLINLRLTKVNVEDKR